jgi:hypothetical protein
LPRQRLYGGRISRSRAVIQFLDNKNRDGPQ